MVSYRSRGWSVTNTPLYDHMDNLPRLYWFLSYLTRKFPASTSARLQAEVYDPGSSLFSRPCSSRAFKIRRGPSCILYSKWMILSFKYDRYSTKLNGCPAVREKLALGLTIFRFGAVLRKAEAVVRILVPESLTWYIEDMRYLFKINNLRPRRDSVVLGFHHLMLEHRQIHTYTSAVSRLFAGSRVCQWFA